MKSLRTVLPVLAAIVATWAITSGTAAQSSIPNGVFLRESSGVVWLVLDGQRVNLAIWTTDDDAIAALPRSDRWAVMDTSGAIVAGDRPQWYESREAYTSLPDPAQRIHTVQENDTWNRIAQQYGVSVDAILQANGITDRNRILRIGERLMIPGPETLPIASMQPRFNPDTFECSNKPSNTVDSTTPGNWQVSAPRGWPAPARPGETVEVGLRDSSGKPGQTLSVSVTVLAPGGSPRKATTTLRASGFTYVEYPNAFQGAAPLSTGIYTVVWETQRGFIACDGFEVRAP